MTGVVLGGISSTITGGNFWEDVKIGGLVAGFNHTLHKISSDISDGGPRKPIKSRRKISKEESLSLVKGRRGGQSVITPENPGNQVGNGRGVFVPTGSQSMVTADITYYDDGTVDINMTTEVSRVNTTGSYIARYEVVGSNGNIINTGYLVNKQYGISPRMDYLTFSPKNGYTVLSTARFNNIPLNSTLRVNVGLTHQIPAGATGVISTSHIIKIK